MPVFAVVGVSDPDKFEKAVVANFADNFKALPHGVGWLVFASGSTPTDVSNKLKVTDGETGSAIVFSILSYWGARPQGRVGLAVCKNRSDLNPTMPADPTRESSPGRLPESTPPQYPMADYSFTLQAVMELQKTVGGLAEAVNTLKNLAERQGEKLDRISHRIYAAIVVIAIALPVLAFLANLFAPVILAALHLTTSTH